MPLQLPVDIYYLAGKKDCKVYDKHNNFVGTTTGYTAIAHNGGKDGGRACLSTPEGDFWIKSIGVLVPGMGIKLTEGITYS